MKRDDDELTRRALAAPRFDNRQLEIVHPEPDSNETLAEAIKVVLEKDPPVDGSKVAVHVGDRGAVRISGAVLSSLEREAAENDIWSVSRVRSVENQLHVAPSEMLAERFRPGR